MAIAAARPVEVYRWADEAWALLPRVACVVVSEPVAPALPTATLALVTGWDRDESARVGAESHTLLAVGDRVMVRFADEGQADGEVLFEGYVASAAVGLSGDDESATWTAKSVAVRLQETFPLGPMARSYGDFAGDTPKEASATLCPGLPMVFNPDGVGNASRAAYVIGDWDTAVFAPAGNATLAEEWSCATALTYLMQAAADALDGDLAWSFPDATDLALITALAVEPRDLSVEGLSWWEAIHMVLRAAGCRAAWRTSGTQEAIAHELVVWAVGTGTVRDAKLQAAGSRYDPAETEISRAAVAIDASAAVTTPRLVGDRAIFEATWPLVPAWPTSLMDTDLQPGDDAYEQRYVRSETALLHWTYRHVGRLWMLNEAGQASGVGTGSQTLFDLSTAVPGGTWMRRPRPFAACLSYDATTLETLPALLEMSLDGGTTWRAISGYEVLRESAGILLTATSLHELADADGETDLWTVLTGASPTNARLRLTASLADDGRRQGVTELLSGSPIGRAIEALMDRRDGYGLRQVLASGSYRSQYDVQGRMARTRSDAETALAEAQAVQLVTAAPTVAGSLTLEDVTYDYWLGDRVSGVAGRGISFQSAGTMAHGPVYPEIVAVTRVFGASYTTELTLEDVARSAAR